MGKKFQFETGEEMQITLSDPCVHKDSPMSVALMAHYHTRLEINDLTKERCGRSKVLAAYLREEEARKLVNGLLHRLGYTIRILEKQPNQKRNLK